VTSDEHPLSSQSILVTTDGPVGVITLNRPHVLNAINTALITALSNQLTMWHDDATIRCVVLQGSDKAFAAGADITQMAQASASIMRQMDPLAIWDTISAFSKPLIAAASGYALGGGLELLLLCDLVIASDTLQIGQPEIKLGVIPGAGGTQRLLRCIGKAKTMEMVLTGCRLNATEAMTLGLVNQVHSVATYTTKAMAMAHTIAGWSAPAVQAAKASIAMADQCNLIEGLTYERERFYALFDTPEQKAGMQAFLDKKTI
jgi:enoyl-CoA hydratase